MRDLQDTNETLFYLEEELAANFWEPAYEPYEYVEAGPVHS